MQWLMLFLVVAGCGRVGFDALGADGPDGPDASDADSDAGGVGGDGGVSLGPFGAPTSIPSLNSNSNDGSFRAAANELTGWFWSGRTGNNELYAATRSDLDASWSVSLLANVNSSSQELDPTVSADGLTLAFRSNRSGGSGGNDLYLATASTPNGPFSGVTELAALNTSSSDVQPFLSADGTELFFSSNRNGNYDVFRSVRSGPSFGPAARVDELSSASDDEDPALSPDGLTIYWRSDRPGGLGQGDIYTARRGSTSEPFGAAELVPNVSTSADDAVSWVSADGLRIYISSNRGGTNHIYVAERM